MRGDVAEADGFRWKYEKTHADQAFSVMETYVVMNLPLCLEIMSSSDVRADGDAFLCL